MKTDRIRTDLNPSKRIRFRIRSENIRTVFIPTMFYKDIGGEVRHLWFALSTDGMNPFDQVRSNHST